MLCPETLNAVQLYAALWQADIAVLSELFPGFALGSSVSYKPQRRPMLDAPTVVAAPKSEEAQQDDLLGVLNDGLEF